MPNYRVNVGFGGLQSGFQARDAAAYLFQATTADTYPSRIAQKPEDVLAFDVWGPTHKWVDRHSEWNWTRAGGDWFDKVLAPAASATGANDWASCDLPTQAAGHDPIDHTMDVTEALQYVQSNARWCAFSMRGGFSPRSIAGKFYPDAAKRPRVEVTYTDSSTATLACWVCATTASTSDGVSSTLETVNVPAINEAKSLFLEFARPTKPVLAATLHFTCTQQSAAGGTPRALRLEGILAPQTRSAAQPSGLAVTMGGTADSGLVGHADVIWLHRYLDAAPESDFISPNNYSVADASYSPHLWTGNPADINTGKLPYIQAGKWINANWPDFWATQPSGSESGKNLSKVSSSYTGDGFVPLLPGLGAIRTHCEPYPTVDGQSVESEGAGWTICDARINMPEPLMGTLDHIRIRYYQRTHITPLWQPMSPANRTHLVRRSNPFQTRWLDRSGKGGIGPSHDTSDGGVSGTSGGRQGWQMRDSWYLCDANLGGPSEPGVAVGWHLFDYQANQPAGHAYGGANVAQGERFGGLGGYGGLWPLDRWVLVEKEMKLNTVANVTYPDFTADGHLRTWINGRLVYERTGMVFRQLPYAAGTRGLTNKIYPFRELGVRDLWLCGFYGGQTPPDAAITFFFTGLVIAHGSAGYIGPMAGVPLQDY